jgi:hypothetical protein
MRPKVLSCLLSFFLSFFLVFLKRDLSCSCINSCFPWSVHSFVLRKQLVEHMKTHLPPSSDPPSAGAEGNAASEPAASAGAEAGASSSKRSSSSSAAGAEPSAAGSAGPRLTSPPRRRARQTGGQRSTCDECGFSFVDLDQHLDTHTRKRKHCPALFLTPLQTTHSHPLLVCQPNTRTCATCVGCASKKRRIWLATAQCTATNRTNRSAPPLLALCLRCV